MKRPHPYHARYYDGARPEFFRNFAPRRPIALWECVGLLQILARFFTI